ncbi:hypothetical protein CAPTEDRAFT_150149 [Capitella teleta]|uniref:DDE-1 domain-containing protein n=1 Tax=Capitella teleta TaxID=283909 RepID=R7T9U3_CAPTE|nr:hypothetical protein CAPTEDRAFT_150149 [Capitella teleta]|eukprot:ELT90523.1 hypothetical protein CAPTEDRAFT_150149 [Capitella teleta]
MRALRQYRPEDIGHMNETTTWLEMPCSGTAHIEGVKSEGVVGNGQRKRRYTTILGAYADGTKLPPFVLLPGKRSPPSGTVPAGLLIHMCGDGKSVSNDNITRIWLTRVWGRRNDRRRLLVWDTFRGHCTADVKEDVRQKFNSDIVYIPGGCTGILQPADVSWNQPFKDHLQAAYDEWLLSGMPTFTPKGNRRAPQLAAFLRWIKAAWDKVTPDIVRHSFKKCGIWNAEDGTEDQVLLHDDSDSDDEFMGFSNEEIEDSHEVAANMASTNMELMGLDADSDDEEQEEGVDDDDGNSDLDDSTSPGD